jgi:hypothetical protein
VSQNLCNEFGDDNSSLITSDETIDFSSKSWANEAGISLRASTNNSEQISIEKNK